LIGWADRFPEHRSFLAIWWGEVSGGVDKFGSTTSTAILGIGIACTNLFSYAVVQLSFYNTFSSNIGVKLEWSIAFGSRGSTEV
jgi:hypothetical protein